MTHILAEVCGTGKDLGFCHSHDIVKYTGIGTGRIKNGDFFVIIGFIDDDAELGYIDSNDLYINGVDARDNVTDNLMVTLSVNKKYWGKKYWSEYVFIS